MTKPGSGPGVWCGLWWCFGLQGHGVDFCFQGGGGCFQGGECCGVYWWALWVAGAGAGDGQFTYGGAGVGDGLQAVADYFQYVVAVCADV